MFVMQSHVARYCMSTQSNKPNYMLRALENVLKRAQIKFIIEVRPPGVCTGTLRLLNRGPWAEPVMSGGKEPGGPTYVTDGLTSGALGPSPKHGGAPAEGEGCDAKREGATHARTWGLARMKNNIYRRCST